jgi:hypothetical protein
MLVAYYINSVENTLKISANLTADNVVRASLWAKWDQRSTIIERCTIVTSFQKQWAEFEG